MAKSIRRIRLRRGDRRTLESWLSCRTTPQRQVERARIVLGSVEGKSGRALSREIGVSLPTVQRWLDRYDEDGIKGLEDRPRSGRPTRITPEIEADVVRRALEETPPQRDALEHTSHVGGHGSAPQPGRPGTCQRQWDTLRD